MVIPSGGRRWAGLVLWLGVCYCAAAIGVLLQGSDVAGRYAEFSKPSWAPPPSVFGPVWTVLYTMMGVAAWRVWSKNGFAGARTALVLFLAQLAVNAAWSPVFFGLNRPVPALGVIILMDLLVVPTVFLFFRHDRVAGALLVPYLAWILFATALNAAIAF